MSEKKITLEIKNIELIVLLIFSGIILFLNLRVTFGTPISFGDEAFHAYLAQWIAENKEYPVWMPVEGTPLTNIGYYRPPLWNLLGASFLFVFGFHEFIIRFLTPFIAVLTGIVVYLLTKRLFNPKVGLIAAIFTLTIPSFVTYSVLFYTDVLLTFFSALSILMFLLSTKENSRKYLILSGIFAAFAFLTKAPGLALYLFFGFAFLYELITEKKFLQLCKKYAILSLILLIILAGFFLRNIYFFGTPSCYVIQFEPLKIFDTSGCSFDKFEDKYQFAGRIEGIQTEGSVYSMGIVNYLNFAYGRIWLVVFGLLAGLILFSLKRDRIINLIFLYLLFFPALFLLTTTRAEDTARYTLMWVPIIALVAGKFFEEIYLWVKKYWKYFGFGVILLIIIFSYQNLKEKLDVMNQVKKFSPLFFEACDWIKYNTQENITLYTVWAHRALYNCQRNAISTSVVPDLALSRDVSYTLEVAEKHKITHFFIQKFSIDPQNRHFSEKYDVEFVEMLENNPEKFNKIYENGPSLQQCIQQGGCDGNILYEILW